MPPTAFTDQCYIDSILVQIAFDDAALDQTPTWYDISNIKLISIRRGRSNPLSNFEAGKATITIDNRDGMYDPDNHGSPEYGDGTRLIPGRQIRVIANAYRLSSSVRREPFNGVKKYLFTGFITEYRTQFTGLDSEIYIEATDALGYLGSRKIFGAMDTPLASNEAYIVIYNILTYINWRSDNRMLPLSEVSGVNTLYDNTIVYNGESALDVIQSVCKSMYTSLYVTANGLLSASRYTAIGDINIRLNSSSVDIETLVYDTSNIYNIAKITPKSGNTQIYTGKTATQFITREYSETIMFYSDADALEYASYIVNRFQYPTNRAIKVNTTRNKLASCDLFGVPTTYRGLTDITLYSIDILSIIYIDINTRYGTTISRPYYVDGINYTIYPEKTTTKVGCWDIPQWRWDIGYILTPVSFFGVWHLYKKTTDFFIDRLGETTYLGSWNLYEGNNDVNNDVIEMYNFVDILGETTYLG